MPEERLKAVRVPEICVTTLEKVVGVDLASFASW